MRSGTAPASIVRASVSANTSPAPALRRVFAHSFTVAPVVKTSSRRRSGAATPALSIEALRVAQDAKTYGIKSSGAKPE